MKGGAKDETCLQNVDFLKRVKHERHCALSDFTRFEEEEEESALPQEEVVSQIQERRAVAADLVASTSVHRLRKRDAVPALQFRFSVRVQPLWRVYEEHNTTQKFMTQQVHVYFRASLHTACTVVEYELCEECIQLIILNECIVIQSQHLEHEGQLFLKQEVRVE